MRKISSQKRIENLFRERRLKLRKRVSLKKYTSFKIGGKAKYFITVRKIKKLIEAIELARKLKIRFLVIGGGSNILFDSRGFDGLIIRNKCERVRIRKGGIVEALSGTNFKKLIKKCYEHSLEGLEPLYGIPGTVGGTVYGNAGAYGVSISDFLKEVEILDENGNINVLKKEDIYFGYRDSQFKRGNSIILRVFFNLKKGKKKVILKRIKEIWGMRRKKIPPYPCAGSYFKNIILENGEKIPAGELIEKAGLKGLKMGRAEVWKEHANFIVNLGGATSSDVMSLAEEIKSDVKEKFGIELEEEVIFVPEKEKGI